MIIRLMLVVSVLSFGYAGLVFAASHNDAFAVTCFKTGEQISGLNKICFYDCLGSVPTASLFEFMGGSNVTEVG